MHFHKILLFLLVICFCNSAAQDKTLPLKHITSELGLSDNQVTCIVRDYQGFMWIGTKDGLNRYDGREFYIFRHDKNDPSSICGNSITCLELDGDSMLWIGTATSGFCCYNPKTGKFITYNKSVLPLFSNSINVIKFNRNKNELWLGSNNGGLQFFNVDSRQIVSKPDTLKGSYYDVAFLNNKAYLGKISGYLRILEGNKLITVGKQQTSGTINKIFIDSDEHIWISNWDNALYELKDDIDLSQHYFFDGTDKFNFSGDEIISIGEDANKTLWCGTKSSGIHFFDLKGKKFLNTYQLNPVPRTRINCIYKDNYNRMWVGTELGIYIYNPLHNQFHSVKLPVKPEIGSCKVIDRAITKGGKEFIASVCGLFYKNPEDTSYSFKEFYYQDVKQELYSIYKDHLENIFIGTNKTVFRLDTSKVTIDLLYPGKKTRYAHFYSIASSRANTITEFVWKGDTLLLPSFYGHCPFLIDHKRKNILLLLLQYTSKSPDYENLIRKIYVDTKNNMWICGASSGILKFYLPDTFDLNTFPFNDSKTNPIQTGVQAWKSKDNNFIASINDVFDITENNDGTYWITTQGSGLIKFSPDNPQQTYLPFEGNYTSLKGISKSANDNLWIISSNGLLNYNINNKRWILYDKSDGIPDDLTGYFFNDKAKERSFGFNGGFISFNPEAILKDKEQPVVSITRLWVMDKPSDSLLYSTLQLNYENNFLKFYISANCFTNNEQLTYHYYLEGIDEEWRNNQNNPLITYTNLPHGEFTLKIKAINSDGLESSVVSMPIVIIPPFYKTIYFYALIAFAVFGGIYLFYRYRIKQILKLQEVRNKIARDLHDDIGSTLGSIHLYSQIAHSKMNGNNDDIKSILEKIESSSSEIIDRTGDAVWAVKATNDTLKNLLLRMESYAASILGAAGISFTLNYDEGIVETKIDMTERKNIFLIFKEAVYNIIKYAECTEVAISLQKQSDKVCLIITDNGLGFDAMRTNAYNGNGIKNMQSRAEEIGGALTIESKPGMGTTITVIV